jgi:hypothetical protein
LTDHGRRARVVDRAGVTRPVESLSPPERDQVYLSLSLALQVAAAQHGIWLPLVLDDPFVRLDAHRIASLAAVLDGFARQGHQVLVFTGQQAAAERLRSLGATVHEIAGLRGTALDRTADAAVAALPKIEAVSTRQRQKSSGRSHAERTKRKPARASRRPNGKAANADHSDAA